MKISTKISKKYKAKFIMPLFLLLAFIVFSSHDLYIKMESYFLEPNQEASLSLYNGTFESSENIITRDRMVDASVTALGKRSAIAMENWKDKDSTVTQLPFKTGEPGTYVVGVSTKPRNINLTAEKFNSYLKSDGVFDMLEQRTKDGLLDQDAVESYQKHVKAIYQVGDVKSDDWNTELGYPIEFVPQANPYDKHSGETLEVLLLHDGKPLANQLVFADYIKSETAHTHTHEGIEHTHDGSTHSHETSSNEHTHDGSTHSHETSSKEHTHDGSTHSHETSSKEHTHDGSTHSHETSSKEHTHDGSTHSHETSNKEHTHDGSTHSHGQENKDEQHSHTQQEGHSHTSGQQLRTNAEGKVTVSLPEDGIYYLRTIYMTNVTNSDELTHQSKWATLTFEVSHSHDTIEHSHDHDEEGGFPMWIFLLGSVFIVGVLFLVFRKKDS